MPTEMQPARSMLEVCQAAAVLVGTSPPSDIEGGAATEEIVARAMYENIVRAEIANRDWKFCDTELELSRDATAPLTSWDARYILPEDAKVMHVQNLLADDVPIPYAILENYVHCDAGEDATVVLVYQKRVDETYWPPAFTMVVIYRMAMLYGASVAGKAEVGSFYNSLAERQTSQGSTRAAQQQTTSKIKLNRFRQIRR